MLSYFVFQNMLGRGGGQRGCLLPTLMLSTRPIGTTTIYGTYKMQVIGNFK